MDRQLLARATENSDAPTPGYMYQDIAKNAASNPAICQEIAQYLTRRLASKNNSNVKYKCLKVIAKTAASPYLRGQFKRTLSQDPQGISSIKEALQFRGPPDPVRGDEPYERVRNAAKEALDAIYSDTPVEQAAPSFSTSMTSSYGASPHQQYGGAGGGGGGGGARRMEGIGNPMFQDPRYEPQQKGIGQMTMNQVAREAKETIVGMIKDPLARNVDAHASNQAGSVPRPGNMYQGTGSYNHPPGRNELMHQTNGQWTMKSNRGPDAVAPPPNYNRDAAYFKAKENSSYAWAHRDNGAQSSGVGGSWASAQTAPPPQSTYQHQATPSITVSGGGGVVGAMPGSAGTSASDGSYEKQLIMELCPPGGMKAEPPPDRLAQFSRIVSNLNPDLVCPALLDCLEEGQPWIIRAKALCVMETCIRSGKKPEAPNNPYADFFHACHAEVTPLTNHNRAAIRDPAKRVLGLLGVATAAGTVHPVTAPPVAAPPAPVANLLDFGDGDNAAVSTPAAAPPAPPQAPPPPPPTAAAAPAGGDSLFGGLKVQGGGAPAPAAPAPRPPPAPTSGNLLGDMMGGEAAPPAPAAPSAAPAGGSQGLFGDMNVKQPPAAAPPAPAQPNPVAQTSSMFDNMSIKDQAAPADATTSKPDDSAASLAAAGSAFAFINQSSSNDTAEKKENAPGPPQVDRNSFDPLVNMTPNTAKKMMQFSPEQMQAMAYQQMMMQQQMQMAQMQMAMAQQRGMPGGAAPPQFAMQMPGAMPVMQNPAAARTSFAFMDGNPPPKEDKKFDFIKDAMTMEKKK